MRKKLKDTSGLTMVEMLCAVLILILLVLMINTGIHMAIRNYYSLTSESETDLLLSSLTDSLADKLRYAVVTKETVTDESGASTVKYTLFMGGEKITLDFAATGASLDELVGLKDDMVVVKSAEGAADKKLLPDAAYGNYNKVSHSQSGSDPIKYKVQMINDGAVDKPIVTCKLSGGTITFEINLKIMDNSTGISKEARGLAVRCLNPVRELP